MDDWGVAKQAITSEDVELSDQEKPTCFLNKRCASTRGTRNSISEPEAPYPLVSLLILDNEPFDQGLVRGNHKKTGETVPDAFEAFNETPTKTSIGRLEYWTA